MLNHKRQSTNYAGYSSAIQFKPSQNIEASHRQPQNPKPSVQFKLPLNLSNLKQKQEVQPCEDLVEMTLTDRTQKRSRRIDLGGVSSSRSSHRLKHCSDIYEAHTQSLQFYTNELKRREQEFIKKRDELEKEHIEKVYFLQRLLKTQINKNIRLDEELKKAKQKNKDKCIESKKSLLKPMSKLNDEELEDLFRQLKKELDRRYEYDGDISQFKDPKSYYSNDLVLSYSKTDESLLLGEVARHF